MRARQTPPSKGKKAILFNYKTDGVTESLTRPPAISVKGPKRRAEARPRSYRAPQFASGHGCKPVKLGLGINQRLALLCGGMLDATEKDLMAAVLG